MVEEEPDIWTQGTRDQVLAAGQKAADLVDVGWGVEEPDRNGAFVDVEAFRSGARAVPASGAAPDQGREEEGAWL